MHLYVLVIIFDELNNMLNTSKKRNRKLSPGSKLSYFYVILLKYLQSTVHNDFTITSFVTLYNRSSNEYRHHAMV